MIIGALPPEVQETVKKNLKNAVNAVAEQVTDKTELLKSFATDNVVTNKLRGILDGCTGFHFNDGPAAVDRVLRAAEYGDKVDTVKAMDQFKSDIKGLNRHELEETQNYIVSKMSHECNSEKRGLLYEMYKHVDHELESSGFPIKPHWPEPDFPPMPQWPTGPIWDEKPIPLPDIPWPPKPYLA